MVKKNKRKNRNCITLFFIISIISIISLVSQVQASPINDLINSYNFDYITETINVTSFSDYMVDSNANGIDDTLIINLTTNASASVTYIFSVLLHDGNRLIHNSTNATVSSASPLVQVTFDTRDLAKDQYNYSVDITDQGGSLLYSKYKVETASYSDYETGDSILSLSDGSISDDYLQLNVTLNTTRNRTCNATVYLSYGGDSISSTIEDTLSTPETTLSFDFDNRTITATHHGDAQVK